MKENIIENFIKVFAAAMENGHSEEDILKEAKDTLFSEDLFLIFNAAKLLVKSRQDAPPKIGSFKRSI